MSRVAILRGESLNPFELQSYEPLLGTYDLVAIGARRGAHELELPRVPVVRLRNPPRGRVAHRVLGDRTARLRGLRRALAGSAVVHSAETFLPISEQAAALKDELGFKLVLTCWETIPFLHDEDPRVGARKRAVRAAADLYLAVTERAREALLLEGVPADRIAVQPVGVDRTRFRPAGRGTAGRTVLYCGRLLREKGLLDLVRAVAALPDARVVLAGEGPERPRLETAARALGVADRVRFAGPVRYAEIADLYATADVFCLPSVPAPYWEEQFGMVLIEAMACGVPVVAAGSGAIPEVVGDAAVLVPPYAPAALAGALASVLDDPARREALASAGPARVAERYDADRVAAAIGGHYARLVESP
jgi:glycosyltransferase involved in cell wall biosynthesis